MDINKYWYQIGPISGIILPCGCPEVLAQSGHDHAVDWWTLGVLTFELMTGHPPFTASSEGQIYQRITKGIRQPRRDQQQNPKKGSIARAT